MEAVNVEYKGYLITTDKSKLQPVVIHKWLSEESYWAKDIPYGLVKDAFDHSYCIGVLKNGAQVGYARLITDYATFGYLADVYVTEEHRGHGLSKVMMETLFKMDWVKGLRRIMLATRDMQALYKKFSFIECKNPERLMEITRLSIYEAQKNDH